MIDVNVDIFSLCDIKPAGLDRWRGRCPLCNVRTSFAVNKHPRGDLRWFCFGCGEYGDAVDLYARVNNLTLNAAIGVLTDGKTKRITDAERVARIADAARASEGKYVLCCATCPRTLELADDLELALACAMAGKAQNWEVAPDAIGAVCWECLGNAYQRQIRTFHATTSTALQ